MTAENPLILARREIDHLTGEIAGMADHLAHWKFHAIWHRCKLTGRDPDNVTHYREAEAELEAARVAENRERYSPEPPRDIGS